MQSVLALMRNVQLSTERGLGGGGGAAFAMSGAGDVPWRGKAVGS